MTSWPLLVAVGLPATALAAAFGGWLRWRRVASSPRPEPCVVVRLPVQRATPVDMPANDAPDDLEGNVVWVNFDRSVHASTDALRRTQ